MRSISSQTTKVFQETTAPLKRVFGLYSALIDVQVHVRDLLLIEPGQVEAKIKDLDEKGAFIEAEAKALLAEATDKGSKNALRSFPAVWGDFKSNLGILYEDVRKGRPSASFMFMMMSGPGQATRDAMNMVVDSYMGRASKMESESRALASSATYVLIAIVALGFLVSIGLSILVANSIARPVLAAARAASSIAVGQLVVKLDTRHARRTDELGDLVRALGAMAEDLNKGMRTIGESVCSIQAAGEDLYSSLGRVNASVSEIGEGVVKVRAETQEQSAGVEETAATVREMTKTIEGLDGEIEAQAKGVSESSSSVEALVGTIDEVASSVKDLGANFEKLLAAAEDGRSKLNNVTEIVGGIAVQSEKLGEANLTVSGIASHTNLLAMNAAIEAAHAGDLGKGFAVVADEIRNLSESAAQQSKEISKDIGEIRNSIEEAVAGAAVARDAFASVQDLIHRLSELERGINSSLEQQRAASRQILDALSGIKSGSDRVRRGSHELKAGSQAIGTEMGELQDTTLGLKNAIDTIAREMESITQATTMVDTLSERNREAVKGVEGLLAHYCLDEDPGPT